MRYVKMTFQALPRVMYAVTFEVKTLQTTARDNPYFEFTYFEKGEVWVEFEGEERFVVAEGGFVVFPPHAKYRIDFVDKSVMHTFITFALLLDGGSCELVTEQEVRPERYERVEYFRNESLFLPLYDKDSVNENIFAAIKRLAKNFKKYADYGNIACAVQALDILIGIAKRIYAKLKADQNKPSNVYYCDVVDQYLREHYSESVSLADIARLVELHPNYLSTVYRKQRGITIMEQLLRLRLEQAKILLRRRKYKIKDVAKLSGFSNFKYFNTVFRRYEGVSPGRYTKTLFNEAKQTYGDFLEENKGLH